MLNSKLWKGLTSVLAFLLILFIFGTTICCSWEGIVNERLGVTDLTEIVDPNSGTDAVWHYKSEFGDGTINEANQKLLEAASKEHNYNEVAEGAALMKNENNALPLDPKKLNVTVFGNNCVNFLLLNQGGEGNKLVDGNKADFKEVMDKAGFKINPVLWNAYKDGGLKRVYGSTVKSDDTIGEQPISFYTDEIKASFNDYSDAAIIVITREGNEGNDLEMVDYAGISNLALHQEERDMIELVTSCGKFDKVIAIINSTNQVELDWVEEYGIDAVLWVGHPGQWGASAIPDILLGKVNPSGRLVDTWAANSLSAPACVNSGTETPMYENIAEIHKTVTDAEMYYTYMSVQVEGIYVGYKYYETRYEDAILGRGGATNAVGAIRGSTEWNYATEMCYPFGLGLSYTTFDETLDSVTDNGDGTMTVKVTVKNTGSVAGKHSVILYAQTPYGDYERENLVEKSAINVVQFEKTEILEPGQSETLEMTVDKYLLASYDYKNAKTYILSAGDYYLAIGSDVHDALNNILAAKGATGMYDELGNSVDGDSAKTYKWHEDFDDITYSESKITGNEITNVFDDCDLNYFFEDDVVTYISRQDWAGTYPTKQTTVAATPEMIEILKGFLYEKPADSPSMKDFTIGNNKGIKLLDLKGLDYDDPLWDEYLDQYTLDQLSTVIAEGLGTKPFPQYGVNRAKMNDGPIGLVSELPYNKTKATSFACEPLLTATFNKDVIRRRGELMGEACLFTRTMSMNAPGCNLHRTPFNGRSSIYFSEDANTTYLVSEYQALGYRAKGASAGAKHFVVNDQEFYRTGLSLFFTEQAMREGSMRAFENVLTKDNSYACMMSFNRIGCYSENGCPATKAVARNEWGYKGFFQTDASVQYTKDYPTLLWSGTDLFTADASMLSSKAIVKRISETDDGNLYLLLRDAVKHAQYANLNSNVMNGMSKDAEILIKTPWWKTAEIAITVGLGVLTLASLVMFVLTHEKLIGGSKKEERK